MIIDLVLKIKKNFNNNDNFNKSQRKSKLYDFINELIISLRRFEASERILEKEKEYNLKLKNFDHKYMSQSKEDLNDLREQMDLGNKYEMAENENVKEKVTGNAQEGKKL